jgi:phosphatidylglycerol:prolipoprotein diacylglycerol transferase
MVVYLKGKRRGRVITAYLLTYPVGRFFLEYFRGDPRVTVPGLGLHVAQFVSILLLAAGCALLAGSRRRREEAEPET